MAGIALSTLTAVLIACGGGDPVDVTSGTVIRNVNVVDTRSGTVRPAMAVALEGDTIRKVVHDADVRVASGVTVIDGSDRYLIPGLLDMHVHSLAAGANASAHWRLHVANGVTGVRQMAGSTGLLSLAQEVNAAAAAGQLTAPEILQTPGDIFTGPYTPDQAKAQVLAQKQQGASFLKVVSGSRDAVLAVLAEGKAQGLRVAGHIPLAMRFDDAAEAGWGSIEHVGAGLGMGLDCSSDETAVRQALLGGQGAAPVNSPLAILSPMIFRALDAPFYRRVTQTFDASKCAAIARKQAALGTWHVPTLVRLRGMDFSDEALYAQDPHLKYVDKATRALWLQLAAQFTATVPADAAQSFRDYYGTYKAVLKILQEQGVQMMTGSDVGGIWVIPGFGLHEEFKQLAAAGLSPTTVLQMATINPARFLGREARMGTVEEGKRADLVLLRANPLQDVSHLGTIASVFLRGRHLDSVALEKMKADVAAAYEAAPLLPASTAIDTSHVH